MSLAAEMKIDWRLTDSECKSAQEVKNAKQNGSKDKERRSLTAKRCIPLIIVVQRSRVKNGQFTIEGRA